MRKIDEEGASTSSHSHSVDLQQQHHPTSTQIHHQIGNNENIPTKQIVFSTLVHLDDEITELDKLEKNVKLSFHPSLDSLYAQK